MTSGAPTDRATLRRQCAEGSTLGARSSIYAWQTPVSTSWWRSLASSR